MEKTFGQIEEANAEAASAQVQSHNQDETSAAVASLTSMLDESTSPGVRVSSRVCACKNDEQFNVSIKMKNLSIVFENGRLNRNTRPQCMSPTNIVPMTSWRKVLVRF